MECLVSRTLGEFWTVQIWKNQWVLFSRHRFRKDAETIETLLLLNTPFEEIKKRVAELSKESKNEIVVYGY